ARSSPPGGTRTSGSSRARRSSGTGRTPRIGSSRSWSSPMAIKGSLKEASLADVCQLLALGQKTGCLSVTDRSNLGQIYFDQGRITYACVVNRRDRLADLLVRDGIITQDQLRSALEQQS